MAELDDLPESVRDAWRQIVIICACDAPETEPHLNAVEAELLRLSRENAELRASLEGSRAMWEDAERDLAALKARIAEAPAGKIIGGRPRSAR